MPISSLVLSQDNIANGASNKFDPSNNKPPFNRLSIDLPLSLLNKKISLDRLNLYYSWPNIFSTNNRFTIFIPNAGGFLEKRITIPPLTNFESIEQLNLWFQTWCIENKFYSIVDGKNNYFISFEANASLYKVSVIFKQVPTAEMLPELPDGYITTLPLMPAAPKITFDNDSEFNLILGFIKGSTLNGNINNIYNSDFSPQLQPNPTIFVKCSHCYNSLSLNQDSSVLYTFTTINTKFGSLVDLEPKKHTWFSCGNSSNKLTLEFTNDKHEPLYIQDSQITVLLLISDE